MSKILDQTRCVVLNSSYEPLSVVSAKRGLILSIEGRASIIDELENMHISSVNNIWPIPKQIVLKTQVRARSTHRVPAQLNNRNLFIRDKYLCQYCFRHKAQLKETEFLTRDHVHPKDLGGSDTWENTVTSCNSCNNKKANMLLTDLNWSLKRKPHIPTIFEIWSKADTKYFRNLKGSVT